jgi:NAD(P)-dependent dehydrogenase (short-subunit alcohol dehydrogenase family)
MLDIAVYGLKDKVAIVTGGSAGIGKGIALEMAKAGASVVVAARNSERVETTVNEIKAMGNRALKVVADVTKREQVDNMIQQTLQEFSTIDVLVNNVGGILGVKGGAPFLEASEDFWDGICTFLCSKAFVKVAIDQKKKGCIVNMSSLSDRAPYLSVAGYGVAKAGITNFTTTMAVELGKYNIRVNSVAPARIETSLSAELYRNMPEIRQVQLKSIPLGRFGTPEDVGRVVVFLASEAAGYVSGATIVISGGLTHLL